MFDVLAIQMTNFKSYRGTHSFKFPTKPGLYFLTGINSFNKRLETNGTGKTSLIDALQWALYGKTSRGLRAGDIITWGESTSCVTVRLNIDGKKVTVTRSQSPNSLTVDGEVVDQQHLLKVIRLNQEAFNYSVVLPQFGTAFFDRSSSEKITLFTEIMELNFWLDKSAEASHAATLAKDEIDTLERSISKKEGRRESLKEDIKSFKVKIEEFEVKRENTIAKLEAKRPALVKEKKTIEAGLKKVIKHKAKVDDDLKQVIDGGEDIRASRDSYVEAEQKLLFERRYAKKAQDKINQQFKEIDDLGPTCPTCKQVVDEKHRKKQIKQLTNEYKQISSDIKGIDVKLGNMQAEQEHVVSVLERANKVIKKLKAEADTWADVKNSGCNKIKSLENDIQDIDDSIEDKRGQSNPFKSMLKQKRTDLKVNKKDLKKLRGKLDECTELHTALKFWTASFKQIRLMVIEDTLRGLEIELNNSLTSLGLMDWQITLDVERENKSGGVTKGFTVMVSNPEYDKPVRWEAWSGGEVQRLRMAGDLGLQNLIMERAGLVNKIEFIDEPSEHLSNMGINDLVETLYERAVNDGKKIYVIEHSPIEFSKFAGVLTTIRDKDGSKLSYEGNEG